MSKNRYEYSWNEFDCVEKVIDKQTQKVYNGCEIAVKLLNKQHKKIAQLEDEVNNLEQLCSICQKEQENDFLKAELEAEYKEHQEAINVADNTIKVLEKALEFMAYNYWDTHSAIMFCDTGVQVNSSEELLNYFKTQAKKELGNE